MTKAEIPVLAQSAARQLAGRSFGPRTIVASEVRIVSSSGSADRLLVAGGSEPDWSQDGQRIAFVNHDGHLSTIRPDGSDLRTIFSPAMIAEIVAGPGVVVDSPSWSPDGQQIAFVLHNGDSQDVYVTSASGMNTRRLGMFGASVTTGDSETTHIDWSPSGAWVAVSAHVSPDFSLFSSCCQIALQSVNTSQLQQLPVEVRNRPQNPAWSTGPRLALQQLSRVSQDDPGQFDIYLMDSDGRNVQRLTQNPSDDVEPAWAWLPNPTPTQRPPTATPTQRPPTAMPSPTPQIDVWIDGGCGEEFESGSTFTYRYRSNVNGHVEVYDCGGAPNCELLQQADVLADEVRTGSYFGGRSGNHRLEARLTSHGVTATCAYRVRLRPTSAPAPTWTPSPTLAPPPIPTSVPPTGLPPTSPPPRPTAVPPTSGPAPTQTPADSKPIAMFVHGFVGISKTQFDCLATPIPYGNLPEADRNALADTLARSGYDVYVARYRSGFLGTDSLDDAASCLRQQIRALRPQPTSPKVTLLAHSLGGIVSRYYIEGATYDGGVDQLITYGSPHLGLPSEIVPILAMIHPTLVVGGLVAMAAVHPGLMQAMPGGMNEFNSAHRPRPSVRYSLIGGKSNRFLTSELIFGDDDGVIDFDSAAGRHSNLFPAGGNLRRWQVDDGHAEVMGKVIFDSYDRSKDSVACVAKSLGLGYTDSSATCVAADAGSSTAGLVGATSIDQDPGQAAEPAFTPLKLGQLRAGESTSLKLLVDGERATVLLGWVGRDVGMTLVDPSGTRISRGNAAIRYPGSTYSENRSEDGIQMLVRYDIVAPRPGWWTVELNAVDADGQFALFGALQSSVQLAVEQPASARPGGSVMLRARMTDGMTPITDAAIVAEILTLTASVPVTLVHRSDGFYKASLGAPVEPAVYFVRVVARGHVGEVEFEREAHLSVAVTPLLPRPIFLPLTQRHAALDTIAAPQPLPIPEPTDAGVIGPDNATRLEVVASFKENGPVRAVAFEASGDVAAWGGVNGATVEDLTRGTTLRHITAHTGQVQNVVFGARTSNLFTAGVDVPRGKVRIWDWQADVERDAFDCGYGSYGAFVTVSPKEKWLACTNGLTRMFSLRARLGDTWEALPATPYGGWWMWLPGDHALYWDSSNGWQDISLPGGETQPIASGAPQPTAMSDVTADGTLLAVGVGQALGIWQVEGGGLHAQTEGHSSNLSAGRFSPDGRLLASADQDGNLKLWRVADGTLVHTLVKHKSKIGDVIFSSDGTRMASVDDGGNVYLWAVK